MFFWIILIGLVALAINNPWWWIGVILTAIWIFIQWWFYKGRPWRKVHYPMMRAYAHAAGLENAMAHNEGRVFNIKNALRGLLNMAKPDWTSDDIEALIEQEFNNCETFKDKTLIRDYAKKKHKNLSDDKLNEILTTLKNHYNINNKSMMIHLIIAALIEQQYSQADRGEYLYEVSTGIAR